MRMKTYSVKQIAEMLNTNPETVRRWIRDKKLSAEQSSRKDGNIITEEELQRFLKATPKYALRAGAGAAAAMLVPGIGIPLAIAAWLTSNALSQKKDESQVLPEEMKQFLQQSIQEHEASIRRKQENLRQLQAEIDQEQAEIEKLNKLLADNL